MTTISNHQTIELVDSLVRFGAFGLLVLIGCLLLRDTRSSWAGRLTAAFVFGVAAYLLCSSDDVRALLGSALSLLHVVCAVVPALFWLAAMALFVDEFRPRYWHLGIVAALALTGLGATANLPSTHWAATGAGLLHQALAIGLFGHALLTAWAGRRADLVEGRRTFRQVFVWAAGGLGAAISAVEVIHLGGAAPAGLETLAAGVIFATTLALSLPALRVDAQKLLFLDAKPADQPAPKVGGGGVPPADMHTLRLVRQAMDTDRLYRQSGLTIAGLAEAIRAPEHHVRRVINAGLGFRNFNAFLNRHRIDAVKEALGNPAKAQIPILTIALEAGFGSLAPFNKAFKDDLGMTPSAYRRVKLGEGLIESENT